MDIKMRLGAEEDIEAVAELYDNLNEYLEVTINYPGWIRGVYPVRRDAEDGVRDGVLFVAEEKEEIIGSMVLRREMEPAYLNAPWQAELDEKDVLVVHTFVVSPKKHRSGTATMMLGFAEQYGRANEVQALRLDVYEKNIPAIGVYERCGYRYIDTVSLGLECHGLDWFKLYEKLLSTDARGK